MLKPTGSIYLHCDPTASHYIKLLMDAVFGYRNFRNEIVWQKIRVEKAQSKQFAKLQDVILLYYFFLAVKLPIMIPTPIIATLTMIGS